MNSTPDFRRPWWLPSAHLETLAAAVNKTPVIRHNSRLTPTRDNDNIVLDYTVGDAKKPLLVIFHGLEGDSKGRVPRLLAAHFTALGWTVAVPHFRSCGGHMNRLPRAYHAADAKDVEWMLNYCRVTFAHTQLFAAGVSLGGAALMRFLIHGDAAGVVAAATVSAPFKVGESVHALSRFTNNKLYGRHFLNALRRKVAQKAQKYPFICDMKKLKAAKTIAEFDELYTAPVHGFSTARDYWRQASSYWTLSDVRAPLLCVNALNDPLVPADSLPPPRRHPNVVFCRPRHGGHGGFFGAPANWLVTTIARFFNAPRR